MRSGLAKSVLGAALVAVLLWTAYGSGEVLKVLAVLAVLCTGVVGYRWLSSWRMSRDDLHDPAVSTLVFPPHSRLH